jgi:hypothetical protein
MSTKEEIANEWEKGIGDWKSALYDHRSADHSVIWNCISLKRVNIKMLNYDKYTLPSGLSIKDHAEFEFSSWIS